MKGSALVLIHDGRRSASSYEIYAGMLSSHRYDTTEVRTRGEGYQVGGTQDTTRQKENECLSTPLFLRGIETGGCCL